MSDSLEQDLIQKNSRFFIKHGLKQDYERIKKYEGEIYYLTDANALASHRTIYKDAIDGGWFGDKSTPKKDGIDGGEF